MPKCSFCGKQYEWPKGLTLVLLDGSVRYLCSSKCRKNYLLGRKAKKIKWIKKEKKTKKEKKIGKKKTIKE